MRTASLSMMCAVALVVVVGCARSDLQHDDKTDDPKHVAKATSSHPELIQLVGPVDEMNVPDDLVDVTQRALTVLLSADAGIYTVDPESFQVSPGPYTELSAERMTDIGQSETVMVYIRQSGPRGRSIGVFCDMATGRVFEITAPVP